MPPSTAPVADGALRPDGTTSMRSTMPQSAQ
jgi:hypothetical protein